MPDITQRMKEHYLSETIWADVTNSFTPDIAKLRFDGPIPLFLYGDISRHNATFEFMKRKGLLPTDDFTTMSVHATTRSPFHAFHNEHPEKEYSDYAFLPNKKLCNLPLTTRKLRGKLLSVSLRGIQVFDRYYFNQVRTQRVFVKLDMMHMGIDAAWVYAFKPDRVLKKDDRGMYHEHGNLKLKPFNFVQDTTGGVFV